MPVIVVGAKDERYRLLLLCREAYCVCKYEEVRRWSKDKVGNCVLHDKVILQTGYQAASTSSNW